MKRSPKKILKAIWKSLSEALFPEDLKCVVCGAELRPEESGVCKRCAPYLKEIQGNVCPVCGYLIEESGTCPDCGFDASAPNARSGAKKFRFRKLTAVYSYEGKVKKLVLDMKDGGKPWLSYWISKRISETIVKSGAQYDAILFPPSTKKTVKRRGYDHMKAVAKRVSESTGIPYIQIFSKASDGEKQAKKGKQERVDTTEKEYVLSLVPSGTRFALIDDVATTCATADTLSGLVKEANPDAEIDCFTFARTLFKN